MNTNKPTKQRNIDFDKLLNKLAELAINPGTSSTDFFRRIVKSVDLLCSPEATAIVALADENLIYVDGTGDAASKVVDWDLKRHLVPDAEQSSTIRWEQRNQSFIARAIEHANRHWGWITIQLADDGNRTLAEQVLAAVAEIVAEFVAVHWLLGRSQEQNFVDRYAEFAKNAHKSLDRRRCSFAIANDLRLLTISDRVSMFSIDGSRVRLVSVSSVNTFEQRTELSRAMTRLVKSCVQSRTGFCSDQSPASTRIEKSMGNFMELTNLDFSVGIPIAKTSSEKPIGFLVFESTEDLDRFQFSRGITFGMPHVALAWMNVRQQERILFRQPLLFLGSLLSTVGITKLVFATLFVAAAIWALFFVKIDHKVRIEGELRPVEQRILFAPADGIVETINVKHGDLIARGAVIIRLRSPDIELKLETNAGEFKKLVNLRDEKEVAINQAGSSNDDPLLMSQLAAELADIEQQFHLLEIEKQYLLERQRELILESPIDGRVITWNVKRSLINKPVRWGDSLMEIADETGPWNLVFHVPETKMGMIKQAQDRHARNAPTITYFLESDVEKRFDTEINEIGDATEYDPETGSFVLIRCEAADKNQERRHGAKVLADVDCGQKSVWFVWTHEIIGSLRRHFVF